jgi:hypothetical protein
MYVPSSGVTILPSGFGVKSTRRLPFRNSQFGQLRLVRTPTTNAGIRILA